MWQSMMMNICKWGRKMLKCKATNLEMPFQLDQEWEFYGLKNFLLIQCVLNLF